MTVRPAVASDRPALVAMALQFIALSQYVRFVTANPAQIERLVDYLLEHGGLFVAVKGDTVVGMIGAWVFTHPISGQISGSEVAWWIDPEHRGGRAALRLLDAAEAWARAQGAQTFQMIAPADSQIGELYRRRGYAELETVYQRPMAA